MGMVLDALASYLENTLIKMAREEVGMLLGVPDKIERMSEKLADLKDFLADAEKRRITDQRVQRWVGELKCAMYDATNILDLCQLKAMERSPSMANRGCFNPLLFCLRDPLYAHNIGSRIKALNQRLDIIKERSTAFSFINLGPYKDCGSNVVASASHDRETSGQIDRSGLVGEKIEADTRKLVDILLTTNEGNNNGSNSSVVVLAIVGAGGIGKTILAQMVFNDKAIHSEFDKKIWLSINQDFNKVELLRTAITLAEGDHNGESALAVLQPILTAKLRGSKFLLVMDDVWNHMAWEGVLKIPLINAAAPGSRVLITTRHENVAWEMTAVQPYHVKILGPNDSWSLLKKQVVSSEIDELDINMLKDIGLRIIGKCGGLPLAIKVMGGLLRKKGKLRRDWEQVLDNSIWSVSEMPREINNAIYLSYEDLPPYLKQCFLYCSLLPKCSKFYVHVVVAMWISEGFIHGESDDLEEIGREYFKEFVSRNLLEPEGCYGIPWFFKMHDVVRSFAQYVARDEALAAHNGGSDVFSELDSQKFLRLSIETKGLQSELEWRSLQKQKTARTLISVGDIKMKPGDSLVTFSSLRTLHIESANVAALVGSLHQLKHLRYLALIKTDISELPANVGKMKLLQHINLSNSECLVKLPDCIVKLDHLRFLYLNGYVDIPRGFGGLVNMRRLAGFRAHMDGDWCSLEELGPLLQLRFLVLMDLENVSMTSSAINARLYEKKHLTDLFLFCTSRVGNDGLVKEEQRASEEEQRQIEKVFDELCPSPSIEFISMNGYFGQRPPRWMMPTAVSTLNNLRNLFMSYLAYCTQIPNGLSQLPSLQVLEIRYTPSIRHVGSEFLHPSQAVTAFPRLKYLRLDHMVEWEEWEWESEEQVQAMPILEDLRVKHCKLSRFPPGLASHARALKILDVSGVQHLKYVENFASLVELRLFDNPDLERISNLPKLEEIIIFVCPNMKVLEGLPALQRLTLQDYIMETLPKYMWDVNPRHLQLGCSLALLTSIGAGQSGPEWGKFSRFKHVKAYANAGNNRRYWYMLYNRDPYKLETNIIHSFVFAGTLSFFEDAQRFESVFKMKRKTFDYICCLVRSIEDMSSYTFIDGRVMCSEDLVAVALIMLTSGAPLETVGSDFSVDGLTVSLVTSRFVDAIMERARHHLRWPDNIKMHQNKYKFESIHGLPNCCGVLDTTHISEVRSSSTGPNCDHEENYNIAVQVVVDPDMRFTNFWVEWSGSRNQSDTLCISPLFGQCEKGAMLNGSKLKASDGSEVVEYIIGDAGYPLLPWLLTPYKERGLSNPQLEFNRRHSAARIITLSALARLKSTWKYVHGELWRTEDPRDVAKMIHVVCILHNIVIDMEGAAMEEEGTSDNHDVKYKKNVCQLADENAIRARDILSQHLSSSRSSTSGGDEKKEESV